MIDYILGLISFMVKVPVNPFLKWLVYALGESSTIGSVILGGWILKIGSYGIYRINMNNEYILINMIIIVLTIWSCINSSIAIYYEIDIKRIIAYSSVILMNMVLGNIIRVEDIGILGSVIVNFSLSIISSGLFIMIGILYLRYLTRELFYYSGLSNVMNVFSKLVLILMTSNISIPLTGSFIGEMLMLTNILKEIGLISIGYIWSILLINILIIWYNTRIIYSQVSVYILKVLDINRIEFIVLVYINIYNIMVGIVPSIVTNSVDSWVYNLVLA